MKYLGVDWGLKKIGLAFSEGELASPLTSIKINSFQTGINKIQEIAKNMGADIIVIGQPEGDMGRMSNKTKETLQKLGFQVVFGDETLSTSEAKKILLATGISQKKRKEDDAISAALILQRYLDEK